MRFDPSARQMNQQTGEAHLADGDGLASHRLAGPPPNQNHGKEAEQPAQEDGSVNVGMRDTRGPAPGARRNNAGEQNPHHPLHGKENKEQPVSAPENLVFVSAEKFIHHGTLRAPRRG
jgi:hypothetical protein